MDDYFHKNSDQQFDKNTDTLLYLAARNEHLINIILPALKKKKIVICDRFIDSTFAYQIYGKSVSRELVNNIHKHILGKIRPDLTILLTVKISKALSRLKKRKKKNRYDKFSKNFYIKAQNSFIKLSKKNKKKYLVLDSSIDNKKIEIKIFETIFKKVTRLYGR